MRVNQIAEQLSISPDSIRYYTRIGLLRPKKNLTNGYREYGEKDVLRLKFILGARNLGFTIKDIEHILGVADQGKTPCPIVRGLIQQRLSETEELFRQMTTLRDRMQKAVGHWSSIPDKDPTGDMICHLIEKFDEE